MELRYGSHLRPRHKESDCLIGPSVLDKVKSADLCSAREGGVTGSLGRDTGQCRCLSRILESFPRIFILFATEL